MILAFISKNLKTILLVKLVLVAVLVMCLTGHVNVGELGLRAEDTKSKDAPDSGKVIPADESKSMSSTEIDGPAPVENTNSNKIPREIVDDGYAEVETAESKRKSFLDELFSVPEIETENMQKEDAGKYLTMLERKKKQVDERVGLLHAREQRLVDIEQSVDTKLKKLEEERRFFLDTIQQEKKLSEERINQLVDLYKKMSPKAAAPVFEKMDKDLVVYMFQRLPQKQVTNILALLKPDVSVKLTEYYGRLRSSREYEMLREINKSLTDEFQLCKGM